MVNSIKYFDNNSSCKMIKKDKEKFKKVFRKSKTFIEVAHLRFTRVYELQLPRQYTSILQCIQILLMPKMFPVWDFMVGLGTFNPQLPVIYIINR